MSYLILSDGPVCSTRWVPIWAAHRDVRTRRLGASNEIFLCSAPSQGQIGDVDGGVKGELNAFDFKVMYKLWTITHSGVDANRPSKSDSTHNGEFSTIRKSKREARRRYDSRNTSKEFLFHVYERN